MRLRFKSAFELDLLNVAMLMRRGKAIVKLRVLESIFKNCFNACKDLCSRSLNHDLVRKAKKG
jgi:hypothetical protein